MNRQQLRELDQTVYDWWRTPIKETTEEFSLEAMRKMFEDMLEQQQSYRRSFKQNLRSFWWNWVCEWAGIVDCLCTIFTFLLWCPNLESRIMKRFIWSK